MIKIKRTYPFWVWLMRFCYFKIKHDQKFTGIGVPGLRDKENPCNWYMPTKNKDLFIGADCESDGHYLCKECKKYCRKEEK